MEFAIIVSLMLWNQGLFELPVPVRVDLGGRVHAS